MSRANGRGVDAAHKFMTEHAPKCSSARHRPDSDAAAVIGCKVRHRRANEESIDVIELGFLLITTISSHLVLLFPPPNQLSTMALSNPDMKPIKAPSESTAPLPAF